MPKKNRDSAAWKRAFPGNVVPLAQELRHESHVLKRVKQLERTMNTAHFAPGHNGEMLEKFDKGEHKFTPTPKKQIAKSISYEAARAWIQAGAAVNATATKRLVVFQGNVVASITDGVLKTLLQNGDAVRCSPAQDVESVYALEGR